MLFKRIDHVEITTDRLEETVAFYRDVLGFKVRERLDRRSMAPLYEIVYMTLGDTVLELLGVNDPAPASQETWQVGYRMTALEVEDMGKALAYLKTRGVEPTVGPVDIGASKRAEIKDVNGLSIELRQW